MLNSYPLLSVRGEQRETFASVIGNIVCVTIKSALYNNQCYLHIKMPIRTQLEEKQKPWLYEKAMLCPCSSASGKQGGRLHTAEEKSSGTGLRSVIYASMCQLNIWG